MREVGERQGIVQTLPLIFHVPEHVGVVPVYVGEMHVLIVGAAVETQIAEGFRGHVFGAVRAA